MKYTIERKEEEKDIPAFKPFSVTIHFETHDEYAYFHDNVMGLLTNVSSHQFHADVFTTGNSLKETHIDGKF